MAETLIRTERSYCRVCTSQCGILVDIEGEHVVRVRGDKEHPVSRGYTCPKGRALGEAHHHPRRIERPMMRIDGTLQPAGWEPILDDIAAKLRHTIDTYGPASVGIFFGSGIGMDPAAYRMAEALQAAIGTPAKFSPLTIDGTAKTLIGSLVGGFPGFSPRPDYERADLVIYIGTNPMISHGHTVAIPNPALTIKASAARGEVWVIDPRRSETAGFATRHLAPRPGTDYAVLAYLIRALLEGADETVLGERAIGVEALRLAVDPFTASHVVEIADVTPADLDDLLASVRKAGRLAVETGTGVTMSVGANLTQWLAWVLMIITDSMNRPGGTWFHPGFVNCFDMFELPLITAPFGPGPKSRPELPSFVGDWPCAAVPDEIEAGNIRAFLNLGGSLLRSFPDSHALRPALESLDLLVTVEITENETSAISSHVLPTRDQLERPDISLWDFLSPNVDMQYTPASLKPVGDRRAGWWIFAELIRRLGGEVPADVPADDREPGADDHMLSRILAYSRCGFEQLAEKRYIEVAREFPAPWVDAHVARLGGWQLAPPQLLAQLDEVSAAHLAAARRLDRLPGSLLLIPRRQRRKLNAQFDFLGEALDVMLNPEDAALSAIGEGSEVIVRSTRGEIVGVARLDDSIRRGVVSVPHGHPDANVNMLSDAQVVDTITGMVRYSGIEVSVEAMPLTMAQ